MDTDNFVLGFTDGNVDNDHMDLSNLDPPIKTNNNIPGEFKHELGSKIIEEFIALSPRRYSSVTHGQSPFQDYPNKTEEKGINNCNNAKHEQYYNALMYNEQRTVDECKLQKIGYNMTKTKTNKLSLNTFDDKKFYVNKFKSYPHDENLYLFKKDLVNKIHAASLDLDKNQLANNILQVTINDYRKLIEAAIRLSNDL